MPFMRFGGGRVSWADGWVTDLIRLNCHGLPSRTASCAIGAEERSNAVKNHALSKVFCRDEQIFRANCLHPGLLVTEASR
jgi:hypothetical protein